MAEKRYQRTADRLAATGRKPGCRQSGGAGGCGHGQKGIRRRDRTGSGGTPYLIPVFGRFSLPARTEYIDRGSSGIFLKASPAKTIWSATLTPIYRPTEQSYIRLEISYVQASWGFSNAHGHPTDNRLSLVAETRCLFQGSP